MTERGGAIIILYDFSAPNAPHHDYKIHDYLNDRDERRYYFCRILAPPPPMPPPRRHNT